MSDAATRVVLLGGGGHARVVMDALALDPDWTLAGVVDPDPAQREVLEREGIATSARLDADFLAESEAVAFHVAVGAGPKGLRARLFQEGLTIGLHPATIVHPSAVIAATAELGEGAFVAALAVLNARGKIGRNAILNTAAVAEHDVVVADHVHLAPRSCLCGGVTVGAEAHVGAGAVVRENLTIGARAVVGLGAAVVRDVAEGATVVGNPARPMRG